MEAAKKIEITKKSPMKTSTLRVKARPSKKGKPTWMTEAKNDGRDWVNYATGLEETLVETGGQLVNLAMGLKDANLKRTLIGLGTDLITATKAKRPLDRHFSK